MNWKIFAIALSVFVTLNSAAVTDITACTNITSPGYYQLASSLSSGDTCIRITSSNVHLNCLGYTITGPGANPGNSAGIQAGIVNPQPSNYTYLSNIEIDSCQVSGFSNGILVRGVTSANVHDSYPVNNKGTGLYLDRVNNSMVSAIQTFSTGLYGSNNSYGIALSSSYNNTLSNLQTLNAQTGVFLTGSSNNAFNGIESFGNWNVGVLAFSSSKNNVFDGLDVHDNFKGVFLSVGSDGNTVMNSRIYKNNIAARYPSITGNNSSGIRISQSANNLFYNNMINNTNNLLLGAAPVNSAWNIAKTSGTNIIGGPYLGGNVWTGPAGGFSTSCSDVDGDGICDSAYNTGAGADNFPLKAPGSKIKKPAHSSA
jgi:hypothetical protein